MESERPDSTIGAIIVLLRRSRLLNTRIVNFVTAIGVVANAPVNDGLLVGMARVD